MEQSKKSKKFNIIVGFFLLSIGIIIGCYLILESKTGNASISQQINRILEKNKEITPGCQANPNNKNQDSDNDGLKDWEEIIWQTNPCKADTDEDGYLDGEEVISGYNPLKPAPDDALPDRNSINPRPLPNNLTQFLSQSLVQKMIKGEIEPTTDVSELSSFNTGNYLAVNEAIRETVNQSLKEFSLPDILDKEIIISSDNSKTAIQTYGQKITGIIKQQAEETGIDKGELFESESHLFYQAIQNKHFAEINKYIEFYRGVYDDIKQISAPSDIKDIHKEQLGIFQVMANIYQSIKEIDADPLKANIALEQYKVINELTLQTIQKIINLSQ